MYLPRITIFKRILIIINVCILIAYLFVCLVPFVNTSENWFIAIPGIGFPLLFFLLVIFIVIWLLARSKWVWVCIIVLLLGFQQITSVFSFHFKKDFLQAKQPNTLRVLQWNVMGWDQGEEKNIIENGGHSFRPVMMSTIQEENADILCFEEFFEPADTLFAKSNIALIKAMGYPYHFFVPAKSPENDTTSGVIIFSKYPAVNKGSYELDRYKRGDHLIYMDVKTGDKVFRIMVTHLIPINFAQWEEDRQYGGSGGYETIFSKLIRGYTFRYPQAELVQQKIAESPYPVVICGDFNDIPNSSTYFKIKGNLQDPFLKKGYWTGRTTTRSFALFSPRIDYILADKKFKVSQFQTIHVPYSDHYPVEADLQY